MSKGTIGVVGSGPAGMATALAARRAGLDVTIYERYPEVKAAGNILNLWPPPQKVLQLIGVDVDDLGAPADGDVPPPRRANPGAREFPQDVIEEYGGGFIGLLRPGLYKRMLEALPEGVLKIDHEVTGFRDRGEKFCSTLRDHEEVVVDVLVGADGIHSVVRRQLWGARRCACRSSTSSEASSSLTRSRKT